MKKFLIVFFFGFLFIFSSITLIMPDKKVNEIENKILTQFPSISMKKILNGSFMNTFDEYVSDQFPLRTNFIKLKNLYSYILGNREFREIYVGKNNKLMEKFSFYKEIIDKNISRVIQISSDLYKKYNISYTVMLIPTSIAFYEDYLPKYAITDNQLEVLNYISKKIDNFYTPYNILNEHKNEYIYFDTDHHWTQLGAKLAFEDYYGEIIDEEISEVSKDFYGTYYSKAILPQIKSDTIYSFKNYNDYKMTMDFNETYDTLYDENKLLGKNKYQYFLHGDPAIAVIEGNSTGDEILIFKDSYAHNFVPFLASKYKKVHIIDTRYYNVDIDSYISQNNQISEVLFFYNISTFNSDILFE